MRLISTITVLIFYALNCLAQNIRTVLFENIPEGNYALSVCDAVTCNDSATILSDFTPYSPYEIDSIRRAFPKIYFNYETEQVISGVVKGTFKKVKKPILHLISPKTGVHDTYDMEGKQRFHLRNMEFVEGTEYILQVTRPSGSDGLIQLYVDDEIFPKVSVSRFNKEAMEMDSTAVAAMMEYVSKPDSFYKTEELPDVMVKGKRIKPMNWAEIAPEKGYGENDPMLKKGYTMEYLITRLGLFVGTLDGQKVPYLYRPINDGWLSRVVRVVPVVFVDNMRMEGYEIEELWNMPSEGIKQIEYFTPSQSEMNLAVRGNEAGALYIFTYPFAKFGKPLSMVNVKHIGYRPERPFSALYNHGATVLWQPSVRVEKDGKVSASFDALEGKTYKAVLEGISDKGELVRKEVTL